MELPVVLDLELGLVSGSSVLACKHLKLDK